MNILYGGAFNPPTIAHFEIIKKIKEKFPDDCIIILPAGDNYKNGELVSFDHRYNMLKILVDKIDDCIIISDYEKKFKNFLGTYHTLKFFKNPHFVIGADQLQELHKWINFKNIIKENKFIVFPRNEINMLEIINSDDFFKYKDNFILMDDQEISMSSSDFRYNYNASIIDKDVLTYIKANKLYEV